VILDPKNAQSKEVYFKMIALISPRPIAWVSSQNLKEEANLAPFSFFMGIGAKPPLLAFAPANNLDGSKKDTLRNIEEQGQFVVNMVSHSLSQQMNDSAAPYASGVNEFEMTGLECRKSYKVAVPSVVLSPAQFECEVHEVLHFAEGPNAANLVIGRIVCIHVADEFILPDERVDVEKLDLIGRMEDSQYTLVRDRFELKRPTVKEVDDV